MRFSLLPGLALLVAMSASTVHAQEWTDVSKGLLKEVQEVLKEKIDFGGLCGVVVEKSGDVLVNVSNCGLFRSADQGATWKHVGKKISGRTETPGCIMLDPTGGPKMYVVLVYGAPIQVSTDRGETMTSFDKKTNHVDWCAVDWTDNKLFLTLKHEGDPRGVLLRSSDGGQSFDKVGAGYERGAYVWDANTAVVARPKSKSDPAPKILRSTDGAKTFEQVADFEAKALPIGHGDSVYWLATDGLMRTKDKGKTWEKLSAIKGAMTGPVFGKTADHLFITAQSGILESHDGGKSWGAPIAPPKEFRGINGMTWVAYDAGHDSIYIVKMAAPLFRLTRK